MLRVCLCEAVPCVKYEAALSGLGSGQSQPQPPSCEDNYLKFIKQRGDASDFLIREFYNLHFGIVLSFVIPDATKT